MIEDFLYPSGKRFRKAQPLEPEAFRYGITGVYRAAPLIEIAPGDMLSKHFRAGEFVCHDSSYRYVRVSAELVRRLEKLQALAGYPLNVISGYRPFAYNREIGGVSNSTHIDGLAADVACSGLLLDVFHAFAETIFPDGGVGFYPTQEYIHVDVRGNQARWVG